MIIPIELQVIKVDVPFLVIGLYLALVAISYALIFYKHHKRNHVEVFELIELFTKYFAVVTLTLIISIIGVDFILVAHEYIDTRVDVIVNVSIGIAIISAAIIHLIFYVKKRLKDFDPDLREADQKHNKKIGEILELIVFIILLTTPLWRIPSFIELYNPENNKEFIKAIIEAFAICISAGFLLLAYNPLDINPIFSKIFSISSLESKTFPFINAFTNVFLFCKNAVFIKLKYFFSFFTLILGLSNISKFITLDVTSGFGIKDSLETSVIIFGLL